ncbi:choice-of-anchor B family protein [Phaeodactylibacter luteus]|uniref:Choice-of-anchor B family protein n=1 Tax=Phaeodactylibacter luteus TaxID=1564516 RepID=A0A5C6S3A9_9BACT|nr:choice-of-anchor B family protein [Phaeodactylibacter luteus]TXB68955.1 choice-of-anchor B family protein [Phaeodactylibacter luteus]
MKKVLLLALGIFATSAISAQLNMDLLSQVQYNTDLNDIWGWADPETGVEYAIVGLRNGVSIVSLADPENAEEVARIPGQNSTWRDMKTLGHFAYITTDQGGTTEGVTVIDLSQLPEAAPYYHWTPELEGLGLLQTCHNIYIDEFGFAYLAGCNINNGGMLILNVDTETGEPEFVAPAPNVYSHDVYTVNNHMYASEIYQGRMAIYDVADKNNIQLLGTQPTPFNFTHNIWVNDAETVAFTTDEVGNAPVAAYDITDFGNIEELDLYRPIETLGENVIPHNVHVWDDYLLISYYTDGGRVVDASRPDNLIEVGNYDTFLGGNGGFSGAWGLYPFLPSQTVLVSDINSGLYVLQPNFMRACWLEGMVTDSITGMPLNEVEVVIDSEQPNLGQTDVFGNYATGQVLSGAFEVTYAKPGYRSKTITVELNNGELTEADVELAPLQSYAISGTTIRSADGSPVPGAIVVAQNELFTFTATTGPNGTFNFSNVTEGEYAVYAGAWGYLHGVIEEVQLNGNASLTIELEDGYQDDFVFDLGWASTGNASSGDWVLGAPVGTEYQGVASHPGADVPDDLGNACYSTGNGGGGAGNDDVDGGNVILTSPVMDLSGYDMPVLSLRYWFYNAGGQPGSTPNDELRIAISNGVEEAEILTVTQSISLWRTLQDIPLNEVIALTDNMRLIITTGDDAEGHIVEAGIDQVLITEEGTPNRTNDFTADTWLAVFPNPTASAFHLDLSWPEDASRAEALVFNQLGQLVERIALEQGVAPQAIGVAYAPGLYQVQLVVDGQPYRAVRAVKAK